MSAPDTSVSIEADEVRATITRGIDGVRLVLIDTTFEPNRSDGRRGLRVCVNEANVIECEPDDFVPYGGGYL